ncbi:hypothetical protein [Xanthobacter versatilis]|uniref:hypothetical protein n=1 Tax=Xanthobacter autotrophicus (strain ATCC BAA-1158 / Py2) TaxID=78245 RepID=UPI00372C152B
MAMSQPSDDELARLVAALDAAHGVLSHAARALELPDTTARRWREMAARKGMLGTRPVLPGFEISRASAELDDAGNVHRQWVTQKPERGGPFTLPEGHVVKGVSALLDADGRVSAQWVKTREGDAALDNIEAIKEAFSDLKGLAKLPILPKDADDDLLTVYALPDLHIGGRSWGEECGEDWDLDIACDTYRGAIADLVGQSRPTRHAIVLGLGDYFHMNDRTNMTPRSGHILDVDGRWPKVYRAGAKIALDFVSNVAARHHDVEVRFLPGNHDLDAAVTLTVAMALYFDGHKRITVNDSPSLHYYRRFGKVLLGATHGHTLKPERMAMMLAADRPEDWGKSKFRHCLFGHVHHESAKEVGSVRVESFNSPAAKDAHAHGGGWRSGRSFTAITFHKEKGEIGRHRVNIA